MCSHGPIHVDGKRTIETAPAIACMDDGVPHSVISLVGDMETFPSVVFERPKFVAWSTSATFMTSTSGSAEMKTTDEVRINIFDVFNVSSQIYS